MAVMTKKEFEGLKKEVPQIPKIIKKEIIEEKKHNKIYTLFHPEINYDMNGEIIVNNETVIIKAGKVETNNELTKDILIKQGYIFMYEKERNNE